MCGIVGSVQTRPSSRSQAELHSAIRTLAHRGPDDEGFGEFAVRPPRAQSNGEPVATVLLGHRRLSIIDLSASAHQPMSSPDGQLHVVFNGEIYNYREVRSELRSLGSSFQTESDTEVLLAAYAAWGAQMLPRLVGMFSFAILDLRSATLFVARDPFGIKPFYYATSRGTFLFASEIKALLEFPGVSRRVNPATLYQFMRDGSADSGNRTLFEDVLQLPAAHYMVVPCDSPQDALPVRYWNVSRTPFSSNGRNAADHFRELFEESIRLHLRSDVPVGVSLSGGIDSSAIAAMVRQVDRSNHEFHAISYIASDPALSEERWCRLAANDAHLQLHAVRISPDELIRDFPALVRAQEFPFGSPTIYAQYRIFQTASELGLKVMLGGNGADQYLGSYYPHFSVHIASLLRAGRWFKAARFARQASSQPTGSFLGMRSTLRHLLPKTIMRRTLSHDGTPAINYTWFRDRNVSTSQDARLSCYSNLHELLGETLAETHLPTLLRIEDRNAMAWSVENRVPFLTPALVELAFGLPEEELIGDDASCKSVLLRAMQSSVPADVLARRDKIGFMMPMQSLANVVKPWAQELLRDAPLIPALNPENLLQEAEAAFGRQSSTLAQLQLWRWLTLIAWAREFQVQC